MSLRDKFEKLQASKNLKPVDGHPELEGVFIKRMSHNEAVFFSATAPGIDDEPEKHSSWMAFLLSCTLCDANGDLIFTESDDEFIHGMDSTVSKDLYLQATAHNAMKGAESVEEAKGNSEPTHSEDSSSD